MNPEPRASSRLLLRVAAAQQAIFCCPPRHISGEQDRKWVSQDSNWPLYGMLAEQAVGFTHYIKMLTPLVSFHKLLVFITSDKHYKGPGLPTTKGMDNEGKSTIV